MKKNKNILSIIILCLIICTLSAQSLTVTSQQKDNQQKSKQLIDRYNKLRLKKNFPLINHDTLLDNVASKIHLNKKYKNLNGSYNEDSIRHLLYRSGIIDYQYEIKEALDVDTSSIFNSYLLSDKSKNIHMGYKRIGNKHLFLKTKSFLKYCYATVYARSGMIDGLHSKSYKTNVKTDSIISFFKILNPDIYNYQFYPRIPLSNERLSNVPKSEVRIVKTNNKGLWNNVYDFVIKSTNSDMFLIISNKNNERVVVIK